MRRLNEHESAGGGYRGLDVTGKPLHAAVVNALGNSGPPVNSRSWFVHDTAGRPRPSWKEIEKSLRTPAKYNLTDFATRIAFAARRYPRRPFRRRRRHR